MKTYRVAGGGAVVCALLYAASLVAQDWTQTGAPVTNWTALACSADGRKIVACGRPGAIYTSTNFGAAWTAWDLVSEWSSVASSADGVTLVAADTFGSVFVSTNSGAGWVRSISVPNCYSVGCSGDGNKLFATSDAGMHWGGALFMSFDSGSTWGLSQNGPHYCVAVTCSADGRKLVAAQVSYIGSFALLSASQDSGESWTTLSAPFALWHALASSADGTRVYGTGGAFIHRTADAGATWSSAAVPALSVACSADGVIAATASAGHIYTSTDSGSTWVSNSVAPLARSSVAGSADGHRLFAAVNGGGIYTLRTTPAPVLRPTRCGGSLLLSWVVPSMTLGLQEGADLSNWSGVGVIPLLNCTNLHYEVNLPMPTGSRFYRLASQE